MKTEFAKPVARATVLEGSQWRQQDTWQWHLEGPKAMEVNSPHVDCTSHPKMSSQFRSNSSQYCGSLCNTGWSRTPSAPQLTLGARSCQNAGSAVPSATGNYLLQEIMPQAGSKSRIFQMSALQMLQNTASARLSHHRRILTRAARWERSYPLLFTSLCSVARLQDNWECAQQSTQPSHTSLVQSLSLLPAFKLEEPLPTAPSSSQVLGTVLWARSRQARDGLQGPALCSGLAPPWCWVWCKVNIPAGTTALWHPHHSFHPLLPITSIIPAVWKVKLKNG